MKRGLTFGRVLLLIVLLVFVLVGFGIYRLFNPSSALPDKGVLVLRVSGALPEAAGDDGLPFLSETPSATMAGLFSALAKARRDERVQEIVLDIGSLQTSMAKVMELREAIESVRESGKKVSAYLSSCDDAEYYLASACDRIIAPPEQPLILNGLRSERYYYKSALENAGIGVETSKRGKYKSAPESYLRDSASAFDLEQRNALLDDINDAYLTGSSASRSLSLTRFRTLVNDTAIVYPESALAERLIDGVQYFDEFKDSLRSAYGIGEEEKFFITGGQYREASVDFGEREKMAIVYVSGGIVDGKSDSSPVGDGDTGSETVAAALKKAADDETVKAIILRVDSPGGSGTAMNRMAKAVKEATAKKPVVVSMASVAASAGYGLSMNATKIIANPITVTGSIGVFSLLPNFGALSKRFKVSRQVLKRGKFSDLLNLYDRLTPEEFSKFDALTERFYQRFITQVAEGRKMSVREVDDVAQGRVWSGKRAKALGLVDDLGGLQKAVSVAKELASIDSSIGIEFVRFPDRKSFYDQFFGGDNEEEARSISREFRESVKAEVERDVLETLLGTAQAAEEVRSLRRALQLLSGALKFVPQAALPYEMNIR